MNGFVVHHRLLADCHYLGRLPAAHLLLHRNAAVPWLILVPETDRDNLLDLPAGLREALLADCKRVSDWLRIGLGLPKVNVAWIGNLVPQLHVHVVGRHPGDPCWPLPVWGHLGDRAAYSPERVAEIAQALLHTPSPDPIHPLPNPSLPPNSSGMAPTPSGEP